MVIVGDSRNPGCRFGRCLHRGPHAFLAVVLVLFLSGCSQTGLTRQASMLFVGRSSVEFSISSDLNQNSPLAFDILFVHGEALLETLESLDAAEWFERRAQILKDHGRHLEAHQWEFVPGQPTVRVRLQFRRGVRGGVAFAGYQSGGSHRKLFNPRRDLLVALGETDWTINQ